MKNIDFGVIIYVIIFIIGAGVKLYSWLNSSSKPNNLPVNRNNKKNINNADGSVKKGYPDLIDELDEMFNIKDYMSNSSKQKKKKEFVRKKIKPAEKIKNQAVEQVPVIPDIPVQQPETVFVQNDYNMTIPEKLMKDKAAAMIAYEVLGPPKALRDD